MASKRKRKSLGSSPAEHAAAGQAAYARIADAADRVRRLSKQGDCGRAFFAYGDLERAYGEAHAHAMSGGRVTNPVGEVMGAQAAFSRACVAGRHPRFARGSQSPDQTIVTAPPELRGKRRRRKR
jgi:hypothetical protein